MSAGLNTLTAGSTLSATDFNDNWLALQTQSGYALGYGVLSGLEISAGSGLSLDVTSGVTQGAKAAAIPSFSGTCPDNVTRYVWLDFSLASHDMSGNPVYAGSLTFTASYAQPSNLACLGKVTTLAGTITDVSSDGRMLLPRSTGSQQYTLGAGVTVDLGTGGVHSTGKIESESGSYFSAVVTSGNVTLTSSQAAAQLIAVSGTPGTTRNVVVPAVLWKQWTVYNGSDSDLVVKTASGTGPTIATLKTAIVFCDGTNVIRATPDT